MVRWFNSALKLLLPVAFTRNIMPVNRLHIPTPEMAESWPHFDNIAIECMPLHDCEVGLLKDYNCARWDYESKSNYKNGETRLLLSGNLITTPLFYAEIYTFLTK